MKKMFSILECQLFNKAKKHIKRKIRNFQAFQRVLINEEVIEAICAIDDIEESFEDILIFDLSPKFQNYEDSLMGEMEDLELLKNDVIKDVESKIAEYQKLDEEESFFVIEELIET